MAARGAVSAGGGGAVGRHFMNPETSNKADMANNSASEPLGPLGVAAGKRPASAGLPPGDTADGPSGNSAANGEHAVYNEQSIEALRALDAVRNRPGMHIGGPDDRSHPHHTVYAVVH